MLELANYLRNFNGGMLRAELSVRGFMTKYMEYLVVSIIKILKI